MGGGLLRDGRGDVLHVAAVVRVLRVRAVARALDPEHRPVRGVAAVEQFDGGAAVHGAGQEPGGTVPVQDAQQPLHVVVAVLELRPGQQMVHEVRARPPGEARTQFLEQRDEVGRFLDHAESEGAVPVERGGRSARGGRGRGGGRGGRYRLPLAHLFPYLRRQLCLRQPDSRRGRQRRAGLRGARAARGDAELHRVGGDLAPLPAGLLAAEHEGLGARARALVQQPRVGRYQPGADGAVQACEAPRVAEVLHHPAGGRGLPQGPWIARSPNRSSIASRGASPSVASAGSSRTPLLPAAARDSSRRARARIGSPPRVSTSCQSRSGSPTDGRRSSVARSPMPSALTACSAAAGCARRTVAIESIRSLPAGPP